MRKSVTVEAPIAKAFEVSTAGSGGWWPATHSIGKSPIKYAVMEQRQGGRWYEVGEDGSTCERGEVLAWEPPTRVLLAWRIVAEGREPDIDFGQQIGIELPVRVDATRVDLEHRLWGRLQKVLVTRSSPTADGAA